MGSTFPLRCMAFRTLYFDVRGCRPLMKVILLRLPQVFLPFRTEVMRERQRYGPAAERVSPTVFEPRRPRRP